MENTESRLQQALQSIQNWTNRQSDPTANPYVKDKSFYDKIINAPLENTKMAAYRDTLTNLDLLKTANNIMPGNREHLTSIAQGLMKQSADVAEQDSNIHNEMTRRNTISEALQGMQGIRNPIEALNVLKTLEATTGLKHNPAEVSAMYGSKESANQHQLQGMSFLANMYGNLDSQEKQRALQREQMAQQERIAGMRMTGGGGINFNPKDAIKVISDVNTSIEKAAMTGNPAERLNIIKELVEQAPMYESISPGLSAKIYNQAAYFYPDHFGHLVSKGSTKKERSGSIMNILNGASTGDPELDELIRGLNLSPSSNDVSNKQYVTLPNGRKAEYIDLNPKIAAWKEKVSSTYGGNYDPYYNRKTYP